MILTIASRCVLPQTIIQDSNSTTSPTRQSWPSGGSLAHTAAVLTQFEQGRLAVVTGWRARIRQAVAEGRTGRAIARHFLEAAWLPRASNVIALDADPTGGLSRWAGRLYEGPTFTCHHEADETRLAHLIHQVAQEVDVILVDTAAFGNRAATVAMTAADAVLIPMVPGEGDMIPDVITLYLPRRESLGMEADPPSQAR